MDDSYISGAIGGGVAALLITLAKKYADVRFGEWLEAERTLRRYARPLWLACQELKEHLQFIDSQHKDPSRHHELKALKLIPQPGVTTIDWYVKDGHYSNITAYLLAAFSSWIHLYERDVVFLRFKRRSLSADFVSAVAELKKSITRQPSRLWTQYFSGIGEALLDNPETRPLGVHQFVKQLHSDPDFLGYYDQLFRYVETLATADLGQIRTEAGETRIEEIISKLTKVTDFLREEVEIPMKVN